jgi:hypothetical protein
MRWSGLILSVIVMVSVLVSGCHMNGETTWTAEAPSPDGSLIADAKTIENSGFGSGSIETVVYLRQPHQSPLMILAFTHNNSPNLPGLGNVTMSWLTPNHLEVTYLPSATVIFQAIKCLGVEISIRETPLRL